LAASMGLAVAPTMKGSFGEEHDGSDAVAAVGAAGCDVDKNPMKNQKNQSALQRLREKITLKRKQKAAGLVGDDDEEREEKAELEGEGNTAKTKKLGRWQRRQQQMEAAKERRTSVTAADDDEDDLLTPVIPANGDVSVAEAAAAKTSKLQVDKTRLRIGTDGIAKNAVGSHKVFGKGSGDSELAQIAKELKGESFGAAENGRSAFLKSVAADLAKRDSSDAAVSRARIHERHQKKRRQMKEERRADGVDDADEVGVGLATLGGGDSASDDGDDDAGGDSSSSEYQGPRGPAPPKKSARPPPKAKKDVVKPKAVPPPVAKGGLNDLESLERDALTKLSSGGLFG